MAQETKAYDGKRITNTLAGLRLQTIKLLGLDFATREKSTVNEHLGIIPGVKLGPNVYPESEYLIIGNAGHTISTESNLPNILALRHQPTDAAPWGIMPLVLRPVDNDLDSVTRAKYALRREEEHGGKKYYAYYAKRLNYQTVEAKDYYLKTVDGETTSVEFNYTDANLHPVKPTMPDYDYETSDQTVLDDGEYVSTSATVRIFMDENDINEYMNVAAIIYGDPLKAVISEFCLCSGIDYQTSGESATGSDFLYDEVASCQVSVFLTTFTNLSQQNGALGYNISIGQPEAMAIAPGQVGGTSI